MGKWTGLLLRKYYLLRCFYIISTAKTASKKIGALIRPMKFVSAEVGLYLYKSMPMHGILF